MVQVKKESKTVRTRVYEPSKDAQFEHKGTACMEPFKTLYASFDGEVHPCCFKGIPKGMGKLKDDDAESIWNYEEFGKLREGILNGNYPARLCGSCVKKNTYPKSHGVNRTVHQYSRWFLREFGVPFHSHIQQRARESLSNEEIVKSFSSASR